MSRVLDESGIPKAHTYKLVVISIMAYYHGLTNFSNSSSTYSN